ncbi:FtsJ-domain-containing protein [Gigaspora margarita]|uniref:FtsJ-domain-containing protein n=1 Tax=Gigaspora margarita TaxID=4874 RepID=A0A8H3WXQ4_GIGMA|nr:FtsJ-domain-containing protein [Gigaspora margarita]
MGKRDKKTAKGRLDKYYHLAKEQGYRARSAFKLIQLNKKYNFLEKSRCLIDLCAAPGGWLQVAKKYMPVSSLIIGVDLVSIKPISSVITLQEDITTDKCRSAIRNELKTWKADVVLHDGAPNVGVSWLQDAFSQSELTLKALKLAVEFLNKGGTFVTKLFRSKDYNNLIWVFNQLFKKVEATKPASSRNVSAEIFVVCRDFLAPKKIDTKFLDPRTVFQEVEIGPVNKSIDVLHPEKRKRHREGYEDGNYTLYKEISVLDFINSDDPIQTLGDVNKLKFDTEEAKELLNHESTTEEIKLCCDDLKVLGKKEFKNLLKWRNILKEKKKQDPSNDEISTKNDEKVDEDQIIQDELDKLTNEKHAQLKRLRRKANEKRQKNVVRMQLKMISPTDIALESSGPDGGDPLFDLKQVDKTGALRKIRKGNMDVVIDQDIDDGDIVIEDQKLLKDQDEDSESHDEDSADIQLEEELDELYEQYVERMAERHAKYRVKKVRKEYEEWNDIQKSESSDDDDNNVESVHSQDYNYSSSSSSDSNSESENDSSNELKKEPTKKKKKLITNLNESDDDSKVKMLGGLSKNATLFFDNPLFKNILDDYDNENNQKINQSNMKNKEIDGKSDKNNEDSDSDSKDETKIDVSNVKDDIIKSNGHSLKRKTDDIGEDANDDIEIVPRDKDSDEEMWDANEVDEDEKKMMRAKEIGLITAEAVTLAQQLVNRQKTKYDLIDEGFRRYTYNDREGLPEWFLDDEKQHNKLNVPVTKEAVQAIKERMKALNARPIKKIAEAKARKKIRAMRKLTKLQKKTDAIIETSDMTEKEKADTISKMLSKTQNKVKREVKLVVAKGLSKGKKGRPKGVKGRYKMVDSRLKKDTRALKRADQKVGSKKRRRK